MRAVVQRVSDCSVRVGESVTGSIDCGLLVYLGVGTLDDTRDCLYLAKKITGLRIFEDSDGKMNLSLEDLPGYGICVVSQFTLFADARKGRRPSYTDAAPPEKAAALYEEFILKLKALGYNPSKGMFRETMRVTYTNEGPVTIILDTRPTL